MMKVVVSNDPTVGLSVDCLNCRTRSPVLSLIPEGQRPPRIDSFDALLFVQLIAGFTRQHAACEESRIEIPRSGIVIP